MSDALRHRRRLLLDLYALGVAAAHPRLSLPAYLPEPPAGRLILLGAGKAAASMAAVAEPRYRDLGDRFVGLAVTRTGYGEPAGRIEIVEAGHPTPDEAGLRAASRALALAEGAGPDDLVLVLLSGGGSANWTLPAGGLTLADKQAITRALVRSGAPIDEMNTLRKHLSRIKGGRLAAAARRARLLTLAISDVPGDDPSVIASGPTVADPTTLAQARAVAASRVPGLPAAARAILDDPANETPKPGDPIFSRADYRIIGRPADMIAAVAAAAGRAGFEPLILGSDLEGEAREVAREHARLGQDLAATGRRVALISGGELTVTIDPGREPGRGGPNQEYALALALALAGTPGLAALAADTDGTDGGAGAASDPAGACVDETTLERAGALGLDAHALLDAHDSTRFFETLGDAVSPGPTRTNVNDLRIILVG